MTMSPTVAQIDILAMARDTLFAEAQAITAMADRLGSEFERAVHLVLDCRGRVVTTGMGKSGIVARKVALKRRGRELVGLSPFKSEKTPSFFVNGKDIFPTKQENYFLGCRVYATSSGFRGVPEYEALLAAVRQVLDSG
mgnify:CR=1 FL=1